MQFFLLLCLFISTPFLPLSFPHQYVSSLFVQFSLVGKMRGGWGGHGWEIWGVVGGWGGWGGPWMGKMRDKVSPENLPPDWSLLRRSIIRENYENMQNLSATYHGSIQRQCFSNGSYNHNLQRTSCVVILPLEWQNCFVNMPEAKIFNWIRPSLLALDRADEEISRNLLFSGYPGHPG